MSGYSFSLGRQVSDVLFDRQPEPKFVPVVYREYPWGSGLDDEAVCEPVEWNGKTECNILIKRDHVQTLKNNAVELVVDAYEAHMPNRTMDRVLINAPREIAALPATMTTAEKVASAAKIVAKNYVKGHVQDSVEVVARSAFFLSDAYDVVAGGIHCGLSGGANLAEAGFSWAFSE